MRPATLVDLPNETLLNIASRLPFSTLVRLKNVNRRWRDVVAETKLDPVTKKLFDAYNCIVALPFLERSPLSVPTLTEADRDRYVEAIRAAAGIDHAQEPQPFGMSVFLTWAKEWPSHAAVRGISPAAVIASFFDKTLDGDLHSKLTRYHNKQYLSYMYQDPGTVLMRMAVEWDPEGYRMRCTPPPMDGEYFIWTRFLPLYTPAPGITSGSSLATLPLLAIPCPDSLGSRIPAGRTAFVTNEGTYQRQNRDWADYLFKHADDAAKALAKTVSRVVWTSIAYGYEHVGGTKSGRPLRAAYSSAWPGESPIRRPVKPPIDYRAALKLPPASEDESTKLEAMDQELLKIVDEMMLSEARKINDPHLQMLSDLDELALHQHRQHATLRAQTFPTAAVITADPVKSLTPPLEPAHELRRAPSTPPSVPAPEGSGERPVPITSPDAECVSSADHHPASTVHKPSTVLPSSDDESLQEAPSSVTGPGEIHEQFQLGLAAEKLGIPIGPCLMTITDDPVDPLTAPLQPIDEIRGAPSTPPLVPALTGSGETPVSITSRDSECVLSGDHPASTVHDLPILHLPSDDENLQQAPSSVTGPEEIDEQFQLRLAAEKFGIPFGPYLMPWPKMEDSGLQTPISRGESGRHARTSVRGDLQPVAVRRDLQVDVQEARHTDYRSLLLAACFFVVVYCMT